MNSERNSYIAFAIVMVGLTILASFLFSGCASLATKVATDPYRQGVCTVDMMSKGEC